MYFRRIIFLPFSLLYGLVMFIRNKLYDWGILCSKKFDLPVISVGNLSAGGTGKTPLVEYLICLLSPEFKVSTLSRGYRRSTRGFRIAGKDTDYLDIGDEPMQYHSKFSEIVVVVHENRQKGITELMKEHEDIQVVLMDDAFQHRRVKPGLSLLLTDFHDLYTDDMVLPSGLLREPKCGAKRADIIIVTKTPTIFSPITRRRILDELRPRPAQEVFFSYMKYEKPVKITNAYKHKKIGGHNTIVLLAGIANPYPLEYYLRQHSEEVITIQYPDHHPYTEEDILAVKKAYDDLYTKRKVIYTTEKDAMRLTGTKLLSLLEGIPMAYIPVKMAFHNSDGEKISKKVLEYVRENTSDR